MTRWPSLRELENRLAAEDVPKELIQLRAAHRAEAPPQHEQRRVRKALAGEIARESKHLYPWLALAFPSINPRHALPVVCLGLLVGPLVLAATPSTRQWLQPAFDFVSLPWTSNSQPERAKSDSPRVKTKPRPVTVDPERNATLPPVELASEETERERRAATTDSAESESEEMRRDPSTSATGRPVLQTRERSRDAINNRSKGVERAHGPTSLKDRHAPLPQTASQLTAEHSLLADARKALANGEPRRALTLANAHERRFSGGSLAPEREALRIQALRQLGAVKQAEDSQRSLEQRHPDSPYRALPER